MSQQRNRIDPASRKPLEEFLAAIPGGFNSISDIAQRRAFVGQLLVEPELDKNVTMENRLIPGPAGEQKIRIYQAKESKKPAPAVVYIHGGGMILGGIEVEAATTQMLCAETGATVISVDYRKAPEFPYPCGPDDCYSAAKWVFDNASELGIDVKNIGIYGSSAGGGLALAVVLMARDRKTMNFKYMLPIYPMIDDRNETSSTHEVTEIGMWDRSGNSEAWTWYLGGKPADSYAAPARAADLTGLPPAFIDVGALDAFRDEDADFALRLLKSGVACEFRVYPGAYHGSEIFAPEADLSKRIVASRIDALKRFIAL